MEKPNPCDSPPTPRLILAVARQGSFSYHALPDAQLSGGHFQVKPAEVATALGLPTSISDSGSQPVRDVLDSLHTQVIKLGDDLSDAADPRYYVFLRLPDVAERFPAEVLPAQGLALAGSASV